MHKTTRTAIALTALLAWNAAFAQQAAPQTPQPAQIPSAAAGQSAPATGTPAGGVALPVTSGVTATTLAVGAVIAVAIGVAVVAGTKDDTGSSGTRTK